MWSPGTQAKKRSLRHDERPPLCADPRCRSSEILVRECACQLVDEVNKLMPDRRKRVLIGGYYGFGNTGDEAILAAMIHDLRALIPDLALVVPAGDPAELERIHRVETFLWTDLGSIVRAVESSDLVILGGGGLFHDYWGVDPETLLTRRPFGITYYASFPYLATLLDKPLMLYGVGVGPLQTEVGKTYTAQAFRQAHAATVRDAESKQLLEAIGVDPDHILVTADPAFSLRAAEPTEVSKLLRQARIPEHQRPIVGVVVRQWDVNVDPASWQAAVAAGLDRFVETEGGTILFVPFQQTHAPLTNDLAVANQIKSRMRYQASAHILEGDHPAAVRASALSLCDLVLGMRLHSLIFAVKGAVPAVGLVYDPKVAHLMARVGCGEFMLDIASLNAEALADLMRRVYRERGEIASRLAKIGDELAQRAQENARIAVEQLADPPRPKTRLSPAVVDFIRQIALKQTRRVDRLELQVDEQARLIAAHDQQLHALSQELDEIRRSRSWRLVKVLGRFRRWLIPLNSLREDLLFWVLGERRRQEPGTPRQAGEAAGLGVPAAAVEATVGNIKVYDPDHDLAQRTALGTWTSSVRSLAHRAARSLPAPVREWLRKARSRTTIRSQAVAAKPHQRPRTGAPPPDGPIRILAPTFFDYRGQEMYYGGAERYLLELVQLLGDLGYDPEVYQAGQGGWVRYYGDVKVVGIDVGGDVLRLNRAFHKRHSEGLLTIYLALNLAAPQCHRRSIGISHGVYWDEPVSQAFADVQRRKRAEVLSAISNLTQLVSVDTNTINWLRATRADLAGKFRYIPNFADLKQFCPGERAAESSDALVVLYPRRLYPPRGFWLVAEVLPGLLDELDRLKFHFVGRADAQEERVVRRFEAEYPGRVGWYFLPPERMQEAYQQADITLIPTLYSEGTSLSCIEALASGNAVIATNVGGLPDLILHGHNGLLIEPNAGALRDAIRTLANQPELRRQLAQQGLAVSRAFSLDRWRERWRSLLEEMLPNGAAGGIQPSG